MKGPSKSPLNARILEICEDHLAILMRRSSWGIGKAHEEADKIILRESKAKKPPPGAKVRLPSDAHAPSQRTLQRMLERRYGDDALEARKNGLAEAQKKYRLRWTAPLPTRLYEWVAMDATLLKNVRVKRKSNGTIFSVDVDVVLGIDICSRVACGWAVILGTATSDVVCEALWRVMMDLPFMPRDRDGYPTIVVNERLETDNGTIFVNSRVASILAGARIEWTRIRDVPPASIPSSSG